MVANLHSLLNKPWYIHSSYGQALYPSLFSILGSNKTLLKGENPNTITAQSKQGQVLAMGENGSISSDDEYVVVMNIKSPIYKYSQECGPQGTQSMMRALSNLEKDAQVAGIVLDIDSGGGQVAGTQEFYDFLQAYSKPVVAYTAGMMCSAAYYIGASSSYIIANKRAEDIGSIGTMLSYVDLNGIYEKMGARIVEEYATKSTEKNEAFRAASNGDTSLLVSEILDPITETFHTDMRAARPVLNEDALTGATYNTQDSLAMGLIDQIGTMQEAIDKVFELSQSSTNNSSISNNQKTTTMSQTTTDRPLLQQAMGLEVALASVDGHSSLSNEHLDALEQTLVTQAQAVTDAQAATQVAVDATATIETERDALTASLDTLISSNSIEIDATATVQEKQTAIQVHITEIGKREAGHPSTVKVDPKQEENNQVDMSLKHYANAPATIRKS